MRPRHQAFRAYALLLTLVVLALVVTAVAGVGRRVSRQSLLALRAQEDLQRRWATLTCERLLLPQAAAALERAEAASGDPQPIRSIEKELALGGLRVRLVFGDEQAKPNLEALHERLGKPEAAATAVRLSRAAGVEAPVVTSPLPDVLAHSSDKSVTPFQQRRYLTLHAVYPGAAPHDLLRLGQRRRDPPTVARAPGEPQTAGDPPLTVWGDGRLNFRRAGRADLEAVCRPIVDGRTVDELIRLRAEYPGLGLSALMERLDLTPRERDGLADRLADRSQCQSLWTVVETAPPGETWSPEASAPAQRRWHRLAVVEKAGDRVVRRFFFEW